MQMASKVDQMSFFDEADEPEGKERTNSCQDGDSFHYEPLGGSKGGIQGGLSGAEDANSSRSAENSPTRDESTRLTTGAVKMPYNYSGADQQASSSKLLKMINIEADVDSPTQQEAGGAPHENDALTIEFTSLSKDARKAQQFTSPVADGARVGDANTKASSTITSETSSQDNGYSSAQAVDSHSNNAQSCTKEYFQTLNVGEFVGLAN